MSKTVVKFVAVCAFLALSCLPVHAALVVLGEDTGASYQFLYNGATQVIPTPHQLILDDATNVTWFDFLRGSLSQAGAVYFADTLEVTFNTNWVDWRLPTFDEFASIRNSGASSVFENLTAARYWLTDTGKVFDFVNGDMENAGPYRYNAVAVTSQVPLPGAVWLLGAGLMGLLGIKRRQK